MPYAQINKFLGIILPLFVLLMSKFFGIYLVASFFAIELPPLQFSNILNLGNYFALDVNNLVTSYADLFMFSILSTGLLLVLFLESKNKDPKKIKKFLDEELNVRQVISGWFMLYGNSLYWLASTWVASFIILYNTYYNITDLWVYLMVLTLTLSLSYYFYIDFINELTLSRQKQA